MDDRKPPNSQRAASKTAHTSDSLRLRAKARQIRLDILDMIYTAKGGHIGGAFSSADILTALFYAVMRFSPETLATKEGDRFVLSKGHACEGYYAILADRGFFPRTELASFLQYKSRLMGHPHPKIPGVEVATGSLGHGLSVAVGMALAAKLDGRKERVFCLAGDGELAEGSIWEAASAASHYRLGNLTCIIDRNGLQISGPTEEVMDPEPIGQRFAAFGWHTTDVDGHCSEELTAALHRTHGEQPALVTAHTVKGRGVSFMENQAGWHHRLPTAEEYHQAKAELEGHPC